MMEVLPVTSDTFVEEKDLLFYYEHLLPLDDLFRWLKYGHDSDGQLTNFNDPTFLARREISLTCRRKGDNSGAEFFIRWQNFKNAFSLREKLLNVDSFIVEKFDIGAVYSIPLCKRESYTESFKIEQKELIFDIDMNDYDDIRTCCKQKKVCRKCWLFIAIAMQCIDTALRQDFGFQHILWVFSGRRGVHAWVCDTSARALPNDARAAICDYLNLCTGTQQQSKKVLFKGKKLHPSIDRAFCISYKKFWRLLEEQDFFRLPKANNGNEASTHLFRLFHYFPGTEEKYHRLEKSTQVKESFKVSCSFQQFINQNKKTGANSTTVWEALCNSINCPNSCFNQGVDDDVSIENLMFARRVPTFIKEIVLAYSYPRLDINVSKDIGHLLKSPFCIHQKTGKICVPLSIEEADLFDPSTAPDIRVLREQFDDPKRKYFKPDERTSLSPYLRNFREFIDEIQESCDDETKWLKASLLQFNANLRPEICF